MNIDQKFIENYLTLKNDDPVVFKLYPWQKEIVDKALDAAKRGRKLYVYRSRPQGMAMVVLEFHRLAMQAGLIKREPQCHPSIGWMDMPGVISSKDQEKIRDDERFKLACLQEREKWGDGEYFTFHPDAWVDKNPFDEETWKRVKEEKA